MRRWMRFSLVGMAGIGIQLGVLWICTSLMRMPAVLSIAVAVEAAVLHNFTWHERWTWRGLPADGRWRRLARFHVSNGFVSVGSNIALTMLIRQNPAIPLLAANLLAIAMTAILNFALADLWVFRRADSGA
jgi:putative flippase GtrA